MRGGRHERPWTAAEDTLLLMVQSETAAGNRGKPSWVAASSELAAAGFQRTPQQARCRYARITRGKAQQVVGAARNICHKCGQIRAGHSCLGVRYVALKPRPPLRPVAVPPAASPPASPPAPPAAPPTPPTPPPAAAAPAPAEAPPTPLTPSSLFSVLVARTPSASTTELAAHLSQWLDATSDVAQITNASSTA